MTTFLLLFFSFLGCEIGTYDVNCSKTCNHCKNSETCEINSGKCDENGCAFSGFKSPMCSGKFWKQGNFLSCITNVSRTIFDAKLLRQYNI